MKPALQPSRIGRPGRCEHAARRRSRNDRGGSEVAGDGSVGGPETPTDLPRRSWLRVFKGAVKEFSDDDLTHSAAALTYYAALAILSGCVAQRVGDLLGVGSSLLTVWSIVKWPLLVMLLMLQVAILYWAAPNARQPGFRWVTPGGVIGMLLWLVASVGFGLYVANFGVGECVGCRR